MPVLILTARGDWTDKVAGFRAGADDYAVKPFRLEEVVIRAQTLVRRAAGHAQALIKAGPATGQPAGRHHPQRPCAETDQFRDAHPRLSDPPPEPYRQPHRTVRASIRSAADRDFKSIEVVIGRLRRKIGEG